MEYKQVIATKIYPKDLLINRYKLLVSVKNMLITSKNMTFRAFCVIVLV